MYPGRCEAALAMDTALCTLVRASDAAKKLGDDYVSVEQLLMELMAGGPDSPWGESRSHGLQKRDVDTAISEVRGGRR